MMTVNTPATIKTPVVTSEIWEGQTILKIGDLEVSINGRKAYLHNLNIGSDECSLNAGGLGKIEKRLLAALTLIRDERVRAALTSK